MKKRFWLQISILLIFLTVTNGFAEDDHLSAVKTNRILYFGVAPDLFPFVYHDEAGELTGLDIDLMQEIGRRMGVAVENIEIAYEGLPAALAVHQVDVIGGALEPGEMSRKCWISPEFIFWQLWIDDFREFGNPRFDHRGRPLLDASRC